MVKLLWSLLIDFLIYSLTKQVDGWQFLLFTHLLKLGLNLSLSACLDSSSICLCSVNKTYDFSVISLIE